MTPTEMLILENQLAMMNVMNVMMGGSKTLSDQIFHTENQLRQHIYIPPEHENFTSNNDLLTK